MNKSDSGFDFDHHRNLLAAADDDAKQLDLINLFSWGKKLDTG